jgi:hypothetical protein
MKVYRVSVLAQSFLEVSSHEQVNISDGTDQETNFMFDVFSDSEYAGLLGANYSKIIDDRCNLNGRYRRAWWINPGFVWNALQQSGALMNRYTASQR